MCICLNCNHINICKQYFFIEKSHSENHISKKPYFNPDQTIINFKYEYKDNKFLIEWDLEECISFKEKPGKWVYFDQKKITI